MPKEQEAAAVSARGVEGRLPGITFLDNRILDL